MHIDYILVGLGLAGIAVAEELEERGKSFVVFEDESQTSSSVAGGMYNPVVLKRFNPVWKAAEQLRIALPFYAKLETRFNKKYDHKIDILRLFKSVEEQNNWFLASDKPLLKPYMVPEVVENNNKNLKADHLMGKVIGTGRVSVRELVEDYRSWLKEKGCLIELGFDHDKLTILKEGLSYGDYRPGGVIFCEGNGLSKNPFFNSLPLEGTKGELITILAPELKLEQVVKSAVFVMPLGNDHYKIGATFNWTDKTNDPTEAGREELISKLQKVISCDFEIIGHEAGVRPTTKDRRPLLGSHPDHPSLSLLNGLGTRGVMLAPLMAKKLIMFLENGTPLDPETDISRFNKG